MNNSTASRKLFLRKFARDELRIADNAPLSKILNELNMTEDEFYPAMERLVQFRKNEMILLNSKKAQKKEQLKEKRAVAYKKRVAKKNVSKLVGSYIRSFNVSVYEFLRESLKNHLGKNVLVTGIFRDTSEAPESHDYTLPASVKSLSQYIARNYYDLHHFRKDSDEDRLKPGDSLVVMEGTNINGDAGMQSFADGPTNCMLTPIKQWAQDKLNDAKGKSTILRYITLGNKIEDLVKTYSTGVPQDKIKEICNKLNISISVSLPFQKNPYICERPDTKTLTSFKFLNPRHNHVEEIIDLKNEIIVTPVKLGEIIEECQRTGTDYYYTKNNRHINVVYTQGAVYRLSHKYADFIHEFEIKYNIASWKIDAVKNPELTRFLTNSCHYNCCMDFRDVTDIGNCKKDLEMSLKSLSEKYEDFVKQINTYMHPRIYSYKSLIGMSYYFFSNTYEDQLMESTYENEFNESSNTTQPSKKRTSHILKNQPKITNFIVNDVMETKPEVNTVACDCVKLYPLGISYKEFAESSDEYIKTLRNPFILMLKQYHKGTYTKKLADTREEYNDTVRRITCYYKQKCNMLMDLHEFNTPESTEVKHIDQEKCYKNFHTCKFYDGFLTRITDFRVTDKIEAPGIYQITDICITNEKFKRYNDFLHLYENGNSYPHPALNFLSTMGTFKILGGCWGMTDDLDMDFKIDAWSEVKDGLTCLERTTFTDKDEGVPFYSKYIGACNSIAYERSYYLRGTEATAQIIRGNVDCEVDRFTQNNEDADALLPIRVSSKKHKVMHLSHVTAFILEYARLNIIEQLMNMKFEQILRVNSDGIYFQGETPELCNNYRVKPSDCFNQNTGKFTTYSDTDRFTSSTFFTDDNIAPYEFGACRSFFRTELAVGGGGSGKTHFNLMDKGQVNRMYVAPTWKLARNKQEEYGCSVGTHASLLNFDPTNNPFANASVLIIDEVSMMTNEEKTQIIEYYHSHKLIFCGDIHHQIPYVTSFKPVNSTVFNIQELDNIMEFNSDYRAKCEKLKDLKQVIRDLIDMHIHTPPKELLRKFNSIAEQDLITRYTVNDMVLCCSNKRKDEFRDLLKGNKYYITKTTNKYSCGDIIITNEDIPKEFFPERRHAFTVHSIQGETCRTNLYISPEIMDMRMFYTAVSRAQTYDQIFIIRD